MFELMKPLRAGAIGLGAVAVGLAAPMMAAAQNSNAPTVAAESAGADAQIVVKDGDTGRLRHATPEEAQALHAARPQARLRAAATPAARSHWSGAQGARLTDDFMNYSVVVKRADGSLVELCVEGSETTAKVLKSAPQLKPASLPTE